MDTLNSFRAFRLFFLLLLLPVGSCGCLLGAASVPCDTEADCQFGDGPRQCQEGFCGDPLVVNPDDDAGRPVTDAGDDDAGPSDSGPPPDGGGDGGELDAGDGGDLDAGPTDANDAGDDDAGPDLCEDVTCGEFAACRPDNGFCYCDDGYHLSGDNVNCTDDPCDPNQCTAPNKGVCTANGLNFDCSCDFGYHLSSDGVTCTEDVCDPNPCTTVPNKGQCADQGGTPTCSCDPGYHDDGVGGCELDVDCNPDGPNSASCNGNGNCSDGTGVIVCDCDDGYAGTTCGQCDTGYHPEGDLCVVDEVCAPNDPTSDSCSEHGTCTTPSGVIVCDCDTEYDGNTCELCASGYQDNNNNDVCEADCATSGLNCGSNGVCSDTDGSAGCECDSGYTGTLCNQCEGGYHDDGTGNCVIDEECMPDGPASPTCNGNGTCTDPGGVVNCDCDTGYDSNNCGECAEGYVGYPGCVPEPAPCADTLEMVINGTPLVEWFNGNQILLSFRFDQSDSACEDGLIRIAGKFKFSQSGALNDIRLLLGSGDAIAPLGNNQRIIGTPYADGSFTVYPVAFVIREDPYAVDAGPDQGYPLEAANFSLEVNLAGSSGEVLDYCLGACPFPTNTLVGESGVLYDPAGPSILESDDQMCVADEVSTHLIVADTREPTQLPDDMCLVTELGSLNFAVADTSLDGFILHE